MTVRLHTQTTGIFPGGTRTQIATTTVNVTNQMATVLNVPLVATVPAGTTELIMEVFTPNGQAPANNSFFIGSNAAAQTGPSYISDGVRPNEPDRCVDHRLPEHAHRVQRLWRLRSNPDTDPHTNSNTRTGYPLCRDRPGICGTELSF